MRVQFFLRSTNEKRKTEQLQIIAQLLYSAQVIYEIMKSILISLTTVWSSTTSKKLSVKRLFSKLSFLIHFLFFFSSHSSFLPHSTLFSWNKVSKNLTNRYKKEQKKVLKKRMFMIHYKNVALLCELDESQINSFSN